MKIEGKETMKKITLTSVLGLALICPAFATVDITADANSAGCNNTVLHTYDGPTSLEADWTANTITLNWYNDNTKITPANNTANSCTYDGSITLPSNEPTKTGYTFDGWQLRTSSQSNPQQTPFDLSTLDPSIYGTDYGYIYLDGSSRLKDTKFGLTQNGEWAVEFSYGFVKGTSTEFFSEDEGMIYCVCTLTGFDAEKDGTYVSVNPESTLWADNGFGDGYYTTDDGNKCANGCGDTMRSNPYLRANFYGVEYENEEDVP